MRKLKFLWAGVLDWSKCILKSYPQTVNPKKLRNKKIMQFVFKTAIIFLLMPKRTYQPKKAKFLRTHGFRKRSRSKEGRKVLKRRIGKGRKVLIPKP